MPSTFMPGTGGMEENAAHIWVKCRLLEVQLIAKAPGRGKHRKRRRASCIARNDVVSGRQQARVGAGCAVGLDPDNG